MVFTCYWVTILKVFIASKSVQKAAWGIRIYIFIGNYLVYNQDIVSLHLKWETAFGIKIFSKTKENSTREGLDIISTLPIQKPSLTVLPF